jgi:hypothetical protein
MVGCPISNPINAAEKVTYLSPYMDMFEHRGWFESMIRQGYTVTLLGKDLHRLKNLIENPLGKGRNHVYDKEYSVMVCVLNKYEKMHSVEDLVTCKEWVTPKVATGDEIATRSRHLRTWDCVHTAANTPTSAGGSVSKDKYAGGVEFACSSVVVQTHRRVRRLVHDDVLPRVPGQLRDHPQAQEQRGDPVDEHQ